jgi:hypothetical protein
MKSLLKSKPSPEVSHQRVIEPSSLRSSCGLAGFVRRARDRGMTGAQQTELTLAADFSASGTFSCVGVLQPHFTLAVAIANFRLRRGDSKKRFALIHSVARKIAGRCFLENTEAERALLECFAASLTAEWIVTIPALGTLRALLLIERFERSEADGFFDLVLRLAGTPSFCELQAEDAETA